jgi:hypothetical protein
MFGAGVYGKSAVVTRQRRVNCYYELRPDGDKGLKAVIFGTPGAKLATAVAGGNPIRGMQGTDTALWLVQGAQFKQQIPGFSTNFTAGIGTSAGPVSIASNPGGSQVAIVDGQNGWVYSPGANTFVPMPSLSWFVPGSQTITNVGGYFVAEIAGTNEFAVSNINDATTGSGLSFGAASAYPDIVKAVDQLSGNLVVFSSTHMEFWQNINGPPPGQPFGQIQSATNRWGLAAVFSRVAIGDSLMALCQTTQGVRRVVQITGYAAQPISDEIDWIINQDGFYYQDAVGLSYQKDKHPFYQLTFPTMNRSFLYDLSTGIWGEAQTGLTAQYAQRHIGQYSTYFNGQGIVSDYSSSNLYTMSDLQFTDNGSIIPREIVTKHQYKSGNRFRVPGLYLDMETGVGTSGGGAGSNPTIMLECSKDSGRSWFPIRYLPLGAIAAYPTRVVARRFGRGRVFTWRIRCTDPVKFVLTDGAIRVKGLKETF